MWGYKKLVRLPCITKMQRTANFLKALALTGCFVFVALFSFVMQWHDFRLTTHYKYPKKKETVFTSIVFWNKGLNTSLDQKRFQQLKKIPTSIKTLLIKMTTLRIKQVQKLCNLIFTVFVPPYSLTLKPFCLPIWLRCNWYACV